MSQNIEAEAMCFLNHPQHAWIPGTVIGPENNTQWCAKSKVGSWCTNKGNDGGEITGRLKKEDLFIFTDPNLEKTDMDDLLKLSVLHDSTILHILRSRYFQDTIYTNIGAIVVALNPFNFEIPWYKDEYMEKYLAEGKVIKENKPHSWAVAHNTYFEMVETRQNQCILVSGESGAGKTEAAKIVMKYLGRLSGMNASDSQREKVKMIGHKILQASPILEGFGNAKTVRNDNSSRFGKFMKVQFDSGVLVGAHTIKYLLEKSRVVKAGEGERCYHSFYQLLASPDREKLDLLPANENKSVSSGGCVSISGVDDAEDYALCRQAMGDVGITGSDQDQIWRTVAGILHLQNVAFTASGEGSQVETATRQNLDRACNVLGADPAKLERDLISTTMTIQGTEVTKHLPPTKALDVRDALCKAVYDNLFSYLVTQINQQLALSTCENFIGLLDIFGFEDFQHNSFEQLCINLANETLQGHYNKFVFEKDVEECKEEGIDATQIKYPDNSACLDLVSGKGGIFALLDEQCSLGKGTDKAFLDAVNEHHSKHSFFAASRIAGAKFVIKHYAGDVSYEIEGFLDKNRDTLKDDLKTWLRSSSQPLIAGLLPAPVPSTGGKSPRGGDSKYVGGYFKASLGELMEVICSTNPHWIRCIKPHPAKKPLMFDGQQVLRQLTSAGVMGTVKVRKEGFPVRITFSNFVGRFAMMAPGIDKSNISNVCSHIAYKTAKLTKNTCQIGKTKVYMKSEAYVKLEEALIRVQREFIIRAQAFTRARISGFRTACKVREKALRTIQAAMRGLYSESVKRRREFNAEKEVLIEMARNKLKLNLDEVTDRQDLEDEEVEGWEFLKEECEDALESLYQSWMDAKPERDNKERERFELENERPNRRALLRQEQEELSELLIQMREHLDSQTEKQLERERVEAEMAEKRAQEEAERRRRKKEKRLQKHRQIAVEVWKEIEEQQKREAAERREEKERRRAMKEAWDGVQVVTSASQLMEANSKPSSGNLFRRRAFEPASPRNRVAPPVPEHQSYKVSTTPSPAADKLGFSFTLSPPTKSVKFGTSILNSPKYSPHHSASSGGAGTPTYGDRSVDGQSIGGGGELGSPTHHSARSVYSPRPRSQMEAHSPDYIRQCFSGAGSPTASMLKLQTSQATKPKLANPRGVSTAQCLSALKRVQNRTKRPGDIPHIKDPFDGVNPKNPSHPKWRPPNDHTIELPDGTIITIPPILDSSDEEQDS